MKKSALLSAVALVALSVPYGAHAQSTEDQISGDDQGVFDENPSDRANVIIVTASKRETTLAETPIAVSVTDSDTIEQTQIRDLTDLQSLVPSLRVNTNQNASATTFTIRGFGNGANNPGIEPSVGVFIDGVYRSRSAAQIADLPNVQRIEVLRGPQSTLFGKNASAGVISIITQEPQFEFGGSASLTYGNYETIVAKADITGPITETIAFSLSGGINQRDGYVDVVNLDQRINDKDRWSARGQILFEPTDALRVRLIGDYSKIDDLCCAGFNVRTGPTTPALNAIAGGQSLFPAMPFDDRILLTRAPENDIENYGGSAQIDYELGAFTLTSITAYRELRAKSFDDGDFTSVDLISNNIATDIDTFTQELRIASDLDGPFNFLIGGFYFDESINAQNDVVFGPGARPYFNLLSGGALNTVEAILGLPVGATFSHAGLGTFDEFDYSNESYSIFGSADLELTDRLTFTVGLNYTHDEKEVVSNVVTTDAFSAIDLVALGRVIGVPAQVAANPQFNPLLGLRALQFLPPFLQFPNAVEDGQTEDNDLAYTLRAAYKATDNINFYATYATGFKASSFNLSRDSRPFTTDPGFVGCCSSSGLVSDP